MVEHDFPDGTRIVSVEQPSGTSEFLLRLDGKQVSRVVIIPMLMRFGAAVLRMDGIGGVETDEAYRNRGYSRRLMEAALRQMRRGDATISTLFGIPDFYQRFGYETAGAEYTAIVPFADTAATPRALPPGWQFRAATGDRRPGPPRRRRRSGRNRAAGQWRPGGAKDRAARLEPTAAKRGRSRPGRLPRAPRRLGHGRGVRLVRR